MTSDITDIVTPPTKTLGYEANAPAQVLPGWEFFGGQVMDPYEDVPALAWPNSVGTYHRMRTDAQIDALRKSIWLPMHKLNYKVKPNGAPDEVVDDISQQLHLPIQGNNDEFILRGRKRFDFKEHLRLALLAPTAYGHMPFEMEGDVDADDLRWRLRKLSPRMPQTIQKFDVARDGGLNGLLQYGTMFDGRQQRGPFQTGIPIPITQLAVYVWEKEGANWVGRSMLRPLYKFWLLKDRMLRIDAIKNERFGAGIPTGTAPPGGDPADYQKMAGAARAAENGGVGLPNGGALDIKGISGSLPDTLASIRMYDEQMARSFLAMFMQLGQTETGSRALGESFLDFFTDSLWSMVGWFLNFTNLFVVEDIVDWNWGQDVQTPLIVAEEDDEQPLDATALAELVYRGALVVDNELQQWIRSRFKMPAYDGAPPLPTKPADVQQDTPPTPKPAKAGKPKRKRERITIAHAPGTHDQADHGTPAALRKPKKVKREKASITSDLPGVPQPNTLTDSMLLGSQPAPLPAGTDVTITIAGAGGGGGSSSTRTVRAAKPEVGHREPTAVEAASKADFVKMQKAWEDAVARLVKAWGSVRSTQIDSLVNAIEKAAKAGDEVGLAAPDAEVLGEDLLTEQLTEFADQALADAIAEADAQGVSIAVDVADVADQIAARASAVANVMARDLAGSAGRNAMLRYAVGVDPKDVAEGTRTALNNLTDAYLNDQLGGAVTAAQNMARIQVMSKGDKVQVYASELLDENTCEYCADEDGLEFDSLAAATADYPSGGYAECAGGPRCRGTLVAVYGEGQN
jgi:hypothetical protein